VAVSRGDERFRLAVEAAPNAVVMVNHQGKIILVNSQTEKLFGYGREELLWQSVEILLPGSSQQSQPGPLARPQALPMRRGHDLHGQRKDGTQFPVELTLSPIETEHGTWVLSVIVDTTDRRRAEAAMREGEERFRNLADTAPVMIWATDPDKRFTFFNKTWLDFTGRTLEQELGNGWAEGVHPEDLDRCFASFSASFDARRDFEIEFRLRRADGEYRWLLCKGVPRFAPSGIFAGYIGSDMDVTDQKYAETARRRNLDEIAHMNRVVAMGELTAALAHELNQPLAAILSNAQAARRFLSDESPDLIQVGVCLADIVADDKRAAEIIQRLRTLVKKGESHADLVDLNEVVHDAIRLLGHDAMLRQASIKFEPFPGLPPVLGDRVQLCQVVLNLLMNGLEAVAELAASDRRELVRTVELDNGFVELMVEDSGKGIAEGDLARVFEPFFSTKPEGLGMGLSISRSIVQAHGGRIWTENNVGGGAVFHCVLPAAQHAPVASPN
jgi:PAS domain S-box-containing protein